MGKSLVCHIRSSQKDFRRGFPGDTFKIEFQSIPKEARNIEIKVFQVPLRKIAGANKKKLITYFGKIENSKIIISNTQKTTAPSRIHMPFFLKVGDKTDQIGIEDEDSFSYRNELSVDVSGIVNGKKEDFIGNTTTIIHYPLVMITPKPPIVNDKNLKSIFIWGQQWARVNKSRKKLIQLTPTQGGTTRADSNHFIKLINAMKEAAKFAPFGIIVLAVGHGDGGQSRGLTESWCDIIPEDGLVTGTGRNLAYHNHAQSIDKKHLFAGTEPGNLLIKGQIDTILLGALERIGDILEQGTKDIREKFNNFSKLSPIRTLILHTCNLGEDKDYISRFADRVRVPIRSHTDFIEYDKFKKSGVKIFTKYENEPEKFKSATVWPTSKLSREILPLSLLPPGASPDPERPEPKPIPT